MLKISIISPKVSMSVIKNVIEKNEFNCKFYVYTYDKLEEIKDKYKNCLGKVDGIFFSGVFGYLYALQNIKPLNIPCKFIAYDTVHILAILLDFVLEHPDIPLNRVYIDFLVPLNNYSGIEKFIKKEHMPICNTSNYVDYEDLMRRAKYLWDNNKIDIMLTRSTNNIKNIEKSGIPFIYIFPTEEIIKETIENALMEIKVNKIENSQKTICMIKPSYKIEPTLDEREYIEVTIHKSLIDIKKELNNNMNISNIANRFELMFYDDDDDEMNLKTIRYIINSLINYEAFEFNLGAGIGSNYDNCIYLAEKALIESIAYGKNEGFAAYENETILGPLSQENTLTYNTDNSDIIKFANENGIDIGNIYRIIGIYNKKNDEKLNSETLSKWLNITQRSCNRIIKQLLKHNLIEPVEIIETKGKGRPIKNYKFISANMDLIFTD